MTPEIRARLDQLIERQEEVSALLSEPEVMSDQDRFRSLSREYAKLDPIARAVSDFDAANSAIADAREMMKDSDDELRRMAQEEHDAAQQRLTELEQELQILLLPTDSRDDSNIFLEIRAGTGGDEAAIFVGDLFRMYSRYAEKLGWQLEVLSAHDGEHGGYKELIARIIGEGAFSRMKFESGAHRVQRVPETESQGRIHTSACTVAILAEHDEVEEITIDPSDLRIDTFRASGAGGQHVNKTDSAIRITHLPTGTVVECQDERSQHKNKARALSLLSARLLDQQRSAQEAELSEERKSLVGSGDRSQRIRTYNFPQGRVTDHRINVTLYKLSEFMSGDMDMIVEPLIQQYQADQLARLSEE